MIREILIKEAAMAMKGETGGNFGAVSHRSFLITNINLKCGNSVWSISAKVICIVSRLFIYMYLLKSNTEAEKQKYMTCQHKDMFVYIRIIGLLELCLQYVLARYSIKVIP